MLLLGRQTPRVSDFYELWTVEQKLPIIEQTAFRAKFDEQLIPWMDLIPLDPETGVNKFYKICAFGCTKEGKHQYLYNVEYVPLFST